MKKKSKFDLRNAGKKKFTNEIEKKKLIKFKQKNTI